MDKLLNFFDMGGYALFVWASYLVVSIVLIVFLALSRRRLKRVLNALTKSKK